MAAGNIKGISISIGGDTSPLEKALKSVDKATGNVQKELKQVEKLLKFDPKNTELLAQKQQLLAKNVQGAAEKLDVLKQAQKQVEQQFKNGEIGEEAFRKFQREVIAAEGQLKAFKNQAKNTKAKIDVIVDDKGINKAKSALKEIGREAKEVGKEIGSALSTGAAAGAAGIGALVIGSTDLNNDLARLRTNASIAGRDLEIMENGLSQITAVTGEADSAVETLSNLMASGFKDNEMEAIINGINGAAIKFSDTLKTEGIADGIQETFATGKSIGMFAELLERSGVDIEKFDEKLAKAKKSGTEANLVMETFAELDLSKTSEEYEKLHSELMENNKSTFEMQKAMADLAIVLTPLVTKVTEIVTKMTEWATNNPTLAKTFAIVSAVILGISTAIRVLVPIIQVAVKVFNILKNSFTVIRTVLLALSGPIGWVIIAVTALIAIGIALYKNWDSVSEWLGKIWGGIKNVASKVFEAIKTKIANIWEVIKTKTANVWGAIKNGISNTITKVKDFVVNGFNTIKEKMSSASNKAKELVINAFGKIKDGVTSRITNLIEKVKEVPSKIKNAIGNMKDKMFSIGKSVIEGILEGITSKFKALKEKAAKIAKTVKEATKNALKINSPSKIMIPMGESTVEGVEVGIEDRLRKLRSTAAKIADTTLNAGSVLKSSAVKNNQRKEVAQVNKQQSANVDFTSLINAIGSLANQQPDVKLFLDGKQVASSVDRQQFNSANMLALTKGVTI